MILTIPTKHSYTTTRHNNKSYIFTLYICMFLCVVGNCLLFYCSCLGNCENCCGINGATSVNGSCTSGRDSGINNNEYKNENKKGPFNKGHQYSSNKTIKNEEDKSENLLVDRIDDILSKLRDFQVLFLGDSKTGKTSIINKYIDKTFDQACPTTISLTYQIKRYSYIRKNKDKTINISLGQPFNTLNVNLQFAIWDTSGTNKAAILQSYYKNANCFVYVYDVTNEKSFKNIDGLIKGINVSENIPSVLVANKIDLRDERVISIEQGKKKAEDLGLDYFECSALTGTGVNGIFETVIRKVLLSQLGKWGVNKEEMGKITIDINNIV